jgi:hypothetical protein
MPKISVVHLSIFLFKTDYNMISDMSSFEELN